MSQLISNWPTDGRGNPLPSNTPSTCADCFAPIKLGALFEQKDGRRVCLRCDKSHKAKAAEKAQPDLFTEQRGLFS